MGDVFKKWRAQGIATCMFEVIFDMMLYDMIVQCDMIRYEVIYQSTYLDIPEVV